MPRKLIELIGLPLKVPDYTTLSRSQSKLSLQIPSMISNESRHVVIDSTGLKIFGEGEWKVRQHSYDKRRTWRKYHVGIDEEAQEVVAAVLSTNDIKDNEILEDLLEQVQEPINQISRQMFLKKTFASKSDGAYDTFECYEQILEREAEPAFSTKNKCS